MLAPNSSPRHCLALLPRDPQPTECGEELVGLLSGVLNELVPDGAAVVDAMLVIGPNCSWPTLLSAVVSSDLMGTWPHTL